jgi:hypothetical protein
MRGRSGETVIKRRLKLDELLIFFQSWSNTCLPETGTLYVMMRNQIMHCRNSVARLEASRNNSTPSAVHHLNRDEEGE